MSYTINTFWYLVEQNSSFTDLNKSVASQCHGSSGDSAANSNPAHYKTNATLPVASSHRHFYIWTSTEGKESSAWGTAREYKSHHHLWYECLPIVSKTIYIFFPKDKNQSKYEVAIQIKKKTKVARPLTSWVLPRSCGRVRCLKALSKILLANRKKKPVLCWWQDCHHISPKTHWGFFSQDFMEQLKQEGAKEWLTHRIRGARSAVDKLSWQDRQTFSGGYAGCRGQSQQ